MNFSCHATSLTPSVLLDARERKLRIEGECYPENPAAFFEPLVAALQAAHVEAAPAFEVRCRLTYVNSASLAWLRRILTWLDRGSGGGGERGELRVVWEYDEEDDGAAELAQDLTSGLHHVELVEEHFSAPDR